MLAILLSRVIAFLWLDTTKASASLAFGSSEVATKFYTQSLHIVAGGSVVLLALVFLSLLINGQSHVTRRILYWPIVIIAVSTTASLLYLTVHLNRASSTNGPVHWQADYQVWDCGKELVLAHRSRFYSQKVGTPLLFENSDNRIHVEGTVVTPSDISLRRFFEVVGGKLTNQSLDFPTNNGLISVKNGDSCNSGVPGELQVFVYSVASDSSFSQVKLTDPVAHILAPQDDVPPGECIIIEFGQPKDQTDHLCPSYAAAQNTGDITGDDEDAH